jgi:hypothetical protein
LQHFIETYGYAGGEGCGLILACVRGAWRARGTDLVIDLGDERIAFLDGLLVLGYSSTLFDGGLAGLDLEPGVSLLVARLQELGTVCLELLALRVLQCGDLVVIAVNGVSQLATGNRQS